MRDKPQPLGWASKLYVGVMMVATPLAMLAFVWSAGVHLWRWLT